MTDRKDQRDIMTRRAFLMGVGQVGLGSLLFGRLYQLQVLHEDKYTTLSNSNRIHHRLILPSRGLIKDFRGQILAKNNQAHRLVGLRSQIQSSAELIEKVRSIVEVRDDDVASFLEKLGMARGYHPVVLKDHLTWDEVARLEIHGADLPGLYIETGERRHYPYAEATAHAVGYVSSPGKDEADTKLCAVPDFRTGKTGVEKGLDQDLRGDPGVQSFEVDVRHRVIRHLSETKSTPGKEIQLTLDARLQELLATALAEHSGSGVVMDVRTGAIKALVSTPSFDPHLFTDQLTHETWNSLIKHPRQPLTNKAIGGLYPPASVFKPIVALAALEAGITNPERRIHCPGYATFYGRKFHCWMKHGHGSMNLQGAIKHSCDVYLYTMAHELGIDRIEQMAKKLGLGSLTGIDIPGEKAGVVPSRAWKKKQYKQSWYPGETLHVGIGQGYMLTTPLQLTLAMARLVNGGKLIHPYMVVGESQPSELETLGLNPKHIKLVMDGMDQCVNGDHGTGHRARSSVPGLSIGGKTGTGQVRTISKEERLKGVRLNKDLEWHLRDHAVFFGYANTDDPKYAMTVMIEHGGAGSLEPPQIVKRVFEEMKSLGELV